MEILTQYPQYEFVQSDEFLFDAADDIIYYSKPDLDHEQGQIALLHEVSHAELNHFDYSSDLELVVMECRAWQRTRELAEVHELSIDEVYISDCLGGYSTWLEDRATCPDCQNFSLQTSDDTYHCFRCCTRWRITTDALDRLHQEKITTQTHSPSRG